MSVEVSAKFDSYPTHVKKKLVHLRSLIYQVAEEKEVGAIDECLKWGEPSYIAKRGSTLRVDWKEKYPDKYSMYFNCNSSLVPTFREIYPDAFNYVDSREISFLMRDTLPEKELRHCIALTLTYHDVKGLPLLGA